MRNARLAVAVLAAVAMSLSSCSAVQPETSAAPASPANMPPVTYSPFVDGRLCDSVRFDLFEDLVTADVGPRVPMEDGLVLDCGSKGGYYVPGFSYAKFDIHEPAINLRLRVFESPDQAQQAFADKGVKPTLGPDEDRGDLDLDVVRAEWTATREALMGLVFEGNLRIEAALYGIAPNGHDQDLFKRFTQLLKELIAELRRMAR